MDHTIIYYCLQHGYEPTLMIRIKVNLKKLVKIGAQLTLLSHPSLLLLINAKNLNS